jgi:hypothetical protein
VIKTVYIPRPFPYSFRDDINKGEREEKTKDEKIKELEKEIIKLKEKIEKYKELNRVKTNEALEAEIKELKTELKKLENVKIELETLKQKHKEVNENYNNANDTIKLKEETIDSITKEKETLEEKIDSLETEIEKLEKENPILKELKDSKGLVTWGEISELSSETIDKKLKLKLRDVGYPYDLEHLKKTYPDLKKLCNLCGVVFEHPDLTDSDDENLRVLLSHLTTIKNEFDYLNVIITTKSTVKLEDAWTEQVRMKKKLLDGYVYFDGIVNEGRPGYKYFWVLEVPKVDISLLSCVIQYLHRESVKYGKIDEFIESIIKILYENLEPFLQNIKIEEENEWGEHLECITKDDDERTILGEKKELDIETKKRWDENFVKKISEIRRSLLINCSKIFTIIQLCSSGELERAEEIKLSPPKIKEVEKKPEVKIEEEKERTFPMPDIPRKKWEKLNSNQKAMFNLMNEIGRIKLVDLVLKFNERARQNLTKQQIFNIYWDTSYDTTWYATIDGEKTKIVYLGKEGKGPNTWYVFKKEIKKKKRK